jgi:hypothetical protein
MLIARRKQTPVDGDGSVTRGHPPKETTTTQQSYVTGLGKPLEGAALFCCCSAAIYTQLCKTRTHRSTPTTPRHPTDTHERHTTVQDEHNSTQLLNLQQLRRAGTHRWWRSCRWTVATWQAAETPVSTSSSSECFAGSRWQDNSCCLAVTAQPGSDYNSTLDTDKS